MTSSETMPVIQTAGLTKVFKDFWRRDRVVAVKDLNLDIRRGEVFGLLGPNGSGKSTAIKMMLGLLYPTRGRISLFGKAPTDVQVKSRIGFLPEESYLYRFLNARETLDYYARLFRQPGVQRNDRIERLLEMVGLAHEAKRRVGEYSKGMARRIGLAQALINDPELLILDEPTAGLDPIGTRQIKDVIRDLGQRGKTILLSSHLLADVEDVCDRVTILYGGQERAAGKTRELLRQQDLTQITTEKLSPEAIEQVREVVEGGRRQRVCANAECGHRSGNNAEYCAKCGTKLPDAGAETTEPQPGRVLEVSSPSDKLETFFLRIVAEAQAANITTSGARAAGKLPDFLGQAEPEGAEMIDSLVSAARKSQRVEATEARPREPAKREPSRQIIEQLTAPGKTESPPEESAQPAPDQTTEVPETRKPVEADRSVIDDLLKKPERTGDGDGA